MVPSFFSSHGTEVYNPKTFFPHAALLGQAFAHCPIFFTAASRRSLDRVSVPVWPANLSVRLPIDGLVGCYLTNYLMGRELIGGRIAPFTIPGCPEIVVCGISNGFPLVSPTLRQIAHALLTRPPLKSALIAHRRSPFDLHVLNTPPAFVLSQDQTLDKMLRFRVINVCPGCRFLLLESLGCLFFFGFTMQF